MPGQRCILVAAQQLGHQARTPWQARTHRHFPVACNLARGNGADHVQNPQPNLLGSARGGDVTGMRAGDTSLGGAR